MINLFEVAETNKMIEQEKFRCTYNYYRDQFIRLYGS